MRRWRLQKHALFPGRRKVALRAKKGELNVRRWPSKLSHFHPFLRRNVVCLPGKTNPKGQNALSNWCQGRSTLVPVLKTCCTTPDAARRMDPFRRGVTWRREWARRFTSCAVAMELPVSQFPAQCESLVLTPAGRHLTIRNGDRPNQGRS